MAYVAYTRTNWQFCAPKCKPTDHQFAIKMAMKHPGNRSVEEQRHLDINWYDCIPPKLTCENEPSKDTQMLIIAYYDDGSTKKYKLSKKNPAMGFSTELFDCQNWSNIQYIGRLVMLTFKILSNSKHYWLKFRSDGLIVFFEPFNNFYNEQRQYIMTPGKTVSFEIEYKQ